MSVRVLPSDPEPNPGPLWEPTVHDGSFPLVAQPGDLYISRAWKDPVIYVFTSATNCERVGREEVEQWVTGGLMKSPTQGQTSMSRFGPRPKKPMEPSDTFPEPWEGLEL